MRMHLQTEHSEVKNKPDRTSVEPTARGNVQHLIRIHRYTSGCRIKTMTLSREGKKAQEGRHSSANHGPRGTRPSTSSSFSPSSLFLLLLSLFADCFSSILTYLLFSVNEHSLNCRSIRALEPCCCHGITNKSHAKRLLSRTVQVGQSFAYTYLRWRIAFSTVMQLQQRLTSAGNSPRFVLKPPN